MILVTECRVHFNFVLDWLDCNEEPVVNLDKLTRRQSRQSRLAQARCATHIRPR
jgi:hypothetical protein